MPKSKDDATIAVEVGTIFDIVHLISKGILTVDFISECKKEDLKVYISQELKDLAQKYVDNISNSVALNHLYLATNCCRPDL